MIEVVHYVGDDGADYFDRWLRRQSADTRARIQTRIDRIEFGNLLGAGSKRRQSRDIEAAQFRWGSYQQEKRDARETP